MFSFSQITFPRFHRTGFSPSARPGVVLCCVLCVWPCWLQRTCLSCLALGKALVSVEHCGEFCALGRRCLFPFQGTLPPLSLKLSHVCRLSVELGWSCHFYVMYTGSFKSCSSLYDGTYGTHVEFMALLAKRKIGCVSFVTAWLKLSPEFLSILVFYCIRVGFMK